MAMKDTESYPWLTRYLIWVDSDSGVRNLILGLSVLCAVLFLLDFVVHRHASVPNEDMPGFHVIVGFAAFTIIVLGAKQLRRLIRRDEQYYYPTSVDAEDYPAAGLDIKNQDDDAVAEAAGSAEDSVPS